MAKNTSSEQLLRRLNRAELLQLLYDKSKQLDELKAENERLKAELERREIIVKDSGSIAEAALRLSGVFEAAQQAIDLYARNTVGAKVVVARPMHVDPSGAIHDALGDATSQAALESAMASTAEPPAEPQVPPVQ